jgi:hypothetical protein
MFLLILKIALALIMTALPFLITPYIKSSKDNSISNSNLYTYVSRAAKKFSSWRELHKQIDPIRKLQYLYIIYVRKLRN